MDWFGRGRGGESSHSKQFEDEPSRFSHRTDEGCEVKKGVEKTPRILVRGCGGKVNLGEGINYEQGDLMRQLDLHVKVLRRQVDIWGWSLQERRGQEIYIKGLSA